MTVISRSSLSAGFALLTRTGRLRDLDRQVQEHDSRSEREVVCIVRNGHAQPHTANSLEIERTRHPVPHPTDVRSGFVILLIEMHFVRSFWSWYVKMCLRNGSRGVCGPLAARRRDTNCSTRSWNLQRSFVLCPVGQCAEK